MNKRIIYPSDDGGVAIMIPASECGLTVEQIAAKDVPPGKPFQIVNVSSISSDRTFRNAWEYVEIDSQATIRTNLNKAKLIAHEKRRKARAAEFAPYDEIIMKQIPGNNFQQAEAARQVIRDKYAVMQSAIDTANTADQIKAIIFQILE
jgi:hypothetical protein